MRLNIASRSGRVTVVAEDGAELRADGANIEREPDGTMRVTAAKVGSGHVEVRCATGTDLVIATLSGRIDVRGRVGETHITTRSGRIEVDHVAQLDVRTASGRLEVGACDGECRVVSRSGSIKVGRAGSVEIAGTSGRVEVSDTGDANVRTMSGRVDIGSGAGGSRVEVRTLSGTVDVEIPRGRRPNTLLKSLSGRVRCDCETGADGEIAVVTTSGTITVTCK